MQPKESDLKPEHWYTAYHKASERVLIVKYLGLTPQGMQFCDRDHNLYGITDFYFWKATE